MIFEGQPVDGNLYFSYCGQSQSYFEDSLDVMAPNTIIEIEREEEVTGFIGCEIWALNGDFSSSYTGNSILFTITPTSPAISITATSSLSTEITVFDTDPTTAPLEAGNPRRPIHPRAEIYGDNYVREDIDGLIPGKKYYVVITPKKEEFGIIKIKWEPYIEVKNIFEPTWKDPKFNIILGSGIRTPVPALPLNPSLNAIQNWVIRFGLSKNIAKKIGLYFQGEIFPVNGIQVPPEDFSADAGLFFAGSKSQKGKVKFAGFIKSGIGISNIDGISSPYWGSAIGGKLNLFKGVALPLGVEYRLSLDGPPHALLFSTELQLPIR